LSRVFSKSCLKEAEERGSGGEREERRKGEKEKRSGGELEREEGEREAEAASARRSARGMGLDH
jgi:hypothetical protein